MADENGRLIAGRYRVGRLLGQGGMGFVWQAYDQVLDREVAVKEVFVPGHDEDRERQAFREARAAARLNHPGIVTIHDLVIPRGYSVFTDHTQHFRAAIPDTWLATTEGQGRRFCAPGGCPYFVQMTALSATWDRSQPIFRAFFATFRPAN